MSYGESLLTRDEHVVRIARPHWITLLPTILVDVALVVIIAGLSGLGIALFPPYTWYALLLLLAPIVHLIARVWTWRNAQTIVTNRRLMRVDGVFEKHVSDTLIEKINDIVTHQSAWGRLLNFGDLEVITGSASGTDYFARIADPIGLKKDLLEQRSVRDVTHHEEDRPAGGGGATIKRIDEIPELIEELADLRDKGLISEADFQTKKRDLLDRI